MDPEKPVEMSEEMLDALRILRSDIQAEEYRKLTASHTALIERLDKEAAARDAQKSTETDPTKQVPTEPNTPTDSGTAGDNPPMPTPPVDSPTPPPRKEPEIDPPAKVRKSWWESDRYSQ